jgi:hypothetical protein
MRSYCWHRHWHLNLGLHHRSDHIVLHATQEQADNECNRDAEGPEVVDAATHQQALLHEASSCGRGGGALAEANAL